MTATFHAFGAADWLALFAHFASLSLLAVGGAITTAPDMHRYLVHERGWLSDAQFSASIAIAQAAPGPNVLFVAAMGWTAGMNAGLAYTGGGALNVWWPWACAALGMIMSMSGILIPSSILTYSATRWAQRNSTLLAIRAFKAGMAPIVIALLIATGWLLSTAQSGPAVAQERLWLLSAVCTVVVWKTRMHMLWLLGVGALLGAAGWV
jgi:chromate transporter